MVSHTGDLHEEAITFFRLQDGLIVAVTDYWPASYEPPERMSAFVERY